MARAHRRVASYNFEPTGISVLLGIGLGYEFEALWALRPRNHRVVIVERFPGMLMLECIPMRSRRHIQLLFYMLQFCVFAYCDILHLRRDDTLSRIVEL